MTSQHADIELGHFQGSLDVVLAAIEAAALDGAILELEDGARCAELDEFVDATTRARPDLAAANRRSREVTFRLGPVELGPGGPLRLPIEGDNLARLRQIAARHPDPVIAVHVHVRDDDATSSRAGTSAPT